jgi:hypothetical protein
LGYGLRHLTLDPPESVMLLTPTAGSKLAQSIS